MLPVSCVSHEDYKNIDESKKSCNLSTSVFYKNFFFGNSTENARLNSIIRT